MKKKHSIFVVSSFAAGVALALVLLPSQSLLAQSGARTQPQGSGTVEQGSSMKQPAQGSASKPDATTQMQGSGTVSEPAGKVTYEQKMWKFIKSTRYAHWAPAGDNGDFRESDRPHGALVKTYMNRAAAGNSEELPHGSIIIKENFSPQKELMAVTLMHRTKGYNPDANDWYWIKFNPDGTVATMDSEMGKMEIAGKAKGCIECHSDADGDDYVFFND